MAFCELVSQCPYFSHSLDQVHAPCGLVARYAYGNYEPDFCPYVITKLKPRLERQHKKTFTMKRVSFYEVTLSSETGIIFKIDNGTVTRTK